MSKISKVVYGNDTLIDLTNDTVDSQHLLTGYTATGADGEQVVGACTYDADTSDGTALQSEIISGKSAYVNGNKLTGSMANNGAVTGEISDVNTPYNIPVGFHDGGGTVSISNVESSKLIPGNIKAGITLLGVVGDYSGGQAQVQSKTATPSTSQQTILPDQGYDYLSQVIINPIPYTETLNAAGGLTATIA